MTYGCGGTIISNKFILTAAHCITEHLIIVRLGKESLIDKRNDTVKAIYRRIKDTFVHPQYSGLTKVHDLALIQVQKTIPFSKYIKPACLQTNLRDESSDVKLTVTGYGTTSPTQLVKTDDLRKAELKSMPLSQCNSTLMDLDKSAMLAPFRNGLIGGQYCAYDPEGKRDACQGDSGGPLQYFPKNKTIATVVGIVSFGISCGLKLPAVYTRVAYYLDWIEPIVWPTT
ncbi:serine protease persephone-like isoform X2 [Contarinia nasturtii]|nr:serine protease persephone-like isoform X2 [Contarinia nasturtii]